MAVEEVRITRDVTIHLCVEHFNDYAYFFTKTMFQQREKMMAEKK